MKVAFLVLAHTDPVHLYRLCAKLAESGDVYVHYDKKSNPREVRARGLERVHFVEPRIRVSWGNFSQVEATLLMMRTALSSNQDYRYFSLHSGQDYPIRPVYQYVDHLTASYPMLFIRACNMWSSCEHYSRLVRRIWFTEPWIAHNLLDKCLRRALNLALSPFRRSYFNNITPFFGSAYWAITRECADFILQWSDAHPEFLQYYHRTLASDEQFFHTIVYNSGFRKHASPPEFRGRGTVNYANHHLLHPSQKKVYTSEDFSEIAASSMFFARKLTTDNSSMLIERIDQEFLK